VFATSTAKSPPSTERSIRYPVTGEPPSEAGGFQLSRIAGAAGVASRFSGADGATAAGEITRL
jgi:hypothetical protein